MPHVDLYNVYTTCTISVFNCYDLILMVSSLKCSCFFKVSKIVILPGILYLAHYRLGLFIFKNSLFMNSLTVHLSGTVYFVKTCSTNSTILLVGDWFVAKLCRNDTRCICVFVDPIFLLCFRAHTKTLKQSMNNVNDAVRRTLRPCLRLLNQFKPL